MTNQSESTEHTAASHPTKTEPNPSAGPPQPTRRRWLQIASTATASWCGSWFGSWCGSNGLNAAPPTVSWTPGVKKSVSDRIAGLLVGGLIGDALGGPPEFSSSELTRSRMPRTRDWAKDRRITEADLQQLATSLRLFGYERMRPSTAPYGPWIEKAPAGTITDDSRHKMILLRAMKSAAMEHRILSRADIAHEFLSFQCRSDEKPSDQESWLCREGLREYRLASRWLLGERDESQALPIERLWGGIANCSGQMMFPPLAAVFAGEPEAAYRATYALDFIDSPAARDICSALNAGLAAALAPELSNAENSVRWSSCLKAMRETDPLRLSKVPFAGRPLHRWLDLVDQLVDRADGRPHVLFQGLETDGRPVYWWDAHFTLLVPLAMLKFCNFNSRAALHLTLDFGHDSDSYAQVLGCLMGAVEGTNAFPAPIRVQVESRLEADYDESIEEWRKLVLEKNARHRNGQAVCEAID